MEEKGDEHKGQLTPVEQLQQRPTDFFIVGIGASAGGIQALQEFFRHVPADSGMAYVVILHLSPDHDSQLASVLQHETKMPVAQVTEKIVIQTDHIYVVPPDRHLIMDDGYIAVMANLQIEDRRAPVDIFFRTLADHHGPRAISVILSGTGANGSMGLKRVKERGGAAFVQNPREAEFNEMPRNAIATDLVDEVLNVAELPEKLISYKNNNGRVQITADAEQRTEDQQQALREIFTLLRLRTGHDFSNYKRPTLLRRIERRISVRDLHSLPEYAKFLQENSEEPTALLKDLLISVTNFFRDKKAFDTVEQDIIPLLLDGKKADDQVRIWVAGCATGEEAYSFAMLCLEKTLGLLDVPKIQIFATDIDEQAIAHAREGYYTLNDAADVSPDRLRRFFNKEGDGYRVKREVRETVMFATHNFLKDPPFSHLDLVSCRNVMIYLNQVAQERVVETFHFALKPGAYLFLGNSESVDGASDLYAGFNREYHIFQSRQVKQRAYPVPESTPALYFDKFKKEPATLEQENKILERISFGDLHQQLLEQYAPPSVVVNEEYDILHLTERAGKYLQIGGGELSQNLLKLVKPELRLELRSALYQAVQRQSAVETRGLKVTVGDTAETINIQVRPVLRSGDTAKGFMLVIFEPATDHIGKEVLLSSDEPVARQLEEELIRVKAQLRAANEQHDFQAEEMKASNEELQAMNEELRSAAEELETSKEELQSMNEELRTVNQELKVKIEETSITGNNLHNLVNSTNIGTIFLDRSFRVVLFTPTAREIFNLRASDYGRPLSDITGNLEYDGLLQDAENVLERLLELEKEVNTKNGAVYLMRITPYRTDEDRIKGVVITFLDITQRRKADEALRASEEKYRTLFETIDEGFHIIKLLYNEAGIPADYLFLQVNPAFERHTGLKEAAGKLGSEIAPGTEPSWLKIYSEVVVTGTARRFEDYNEATSRWYDTYASRVGGPENAQVAIVFSDITERKYAEQRQAFLLKLSDELRPLSDPSAIQGTVTRLAREQFNLDRCYYCEVAGNDVIVRRDASADGLPSIKGTYPIADMPMYMQVMESGQPLVVNDINYANTFDDALRQTCLQLQLVALINVPVIKDGNPAGIFCFIQSKPRQWSAFEVDIAVEIAELTWAAVERSKTEEALKDSEDRFRSFVTASSDVVYRMSADWQEMYMLSGKNLLKNTNIPDFNWVDTYILQEDRRQVWKKIKHAIANKELFELEHRVIRSDGSPGWVLSRALPKLDGEGQISEWIGAASDITLRKQAEQELYNFNARLEQEVADRTGELNSSRELLQATLDSSIQMIQVFEAVRDGEGRIIDFIWVLNNAASEKIYGDVINKSLLVHNPGVVAEGILQEFIDVVETGKPRQYEMHYAHEQFDGWFLQAAVKLNDRLVVSTVDISELKKAEFALKESRDTLQSVFDTTLIGMSVFTAVRNEANGISDFTILLVNKVIEEKTGRKDLEGKLYAQEFPGVKDTGLFEVMVKVIETGAPIQYEYHYAYEGFNNWFSSMFVKMGDGLVATNLDITERKRAESERMKSFTLLQQSEDVALMGSWDYDLRSKAFSWSDGMYRLFGLEKDVKIEPEIYGQYATPGCHDVAARIAGYIRQGTEDFEETLSINVNDTKKTVKIKATVIKDNDGRPVRVLGVDIDITAAKEAEEKMRLMEGERQLEILRTTLRTQEEERKRISESLHNGLGQLLYAIRISMNELNPAAAQKNENEFAASKAYTEGLLTDAIKESRRISHELMPMVLEEFGLEAAINDVCQQLGEQVKFQCTIDLKGTSPDEYMQLAIFRTVQELMLNVVKHAGATRADVYIVALENKILIKVEDNGNGVKEPAAGKKGIGLSSIRSKASLLNGSVNISSNPGTGTTVEVTFEVTNQKG